MKKALHVARSNILKNKSAVVTLFVIVMLVSALATIGLSLILNVEKEFVASSDRMNSMHCLFVMTREQYLPSFEDIIKDDPRVAQYEIGEVLFTDRVKINYGGALDVGVLLLDMDAPMSISAPKIAEQDVSIPSESAIYLPVFAKSFGYKTGDPFTILYRNKPFSLTVAGFFESCELSVANGMMLKFFVASDCYASLARYIERGVWVTARCYDTDEAVQFYKDFNDKIDVELSLSGDGSFRTNWFMIYDTVITPITIIAAVILIFTVLVGVIAVMVMRFRVANSIEGSMHEIGVMKASGYTSGQIVACYLTEYGLISLCAALVGIALPVPALVLMRQVVTFMTGVTLELGINPAAGLAAALCITLVILVMVAQSCRRIRKMQPVDALRGGIVGNGFRRNYFPLHRGAWNVQTRLGLKNIFAYAKSYLMTGVIIAGISIALTIIIALYQGMVLNPIAFIKIVGIEVSDVRLTVSRHTDADALEAELARLPEVRHTSMLDWISLEVDGVDMMSFTSSDFSRMELMSTHDGRFPKYDNEVAIPKLLADRFGKRIGDSVKVKAKGVSLDYIITGFFSTTNNSGEVTYITLEGYQKLDPNYRRNNINIYLNEGVNFEQFSEILKQNYGVVNVYRQDGDGRFAAAKARAEEKISYYMEYYNIDSVDYAVIYNGEIILSGSSGAYQIERIEDVNELLKSQVGTYGGVVATVTQMVSFVSLIVITLILSMTVRQIIVKRRRELGILKSVGFTTRQLAWQLAISFLPCALMGVLVGCVAGGVLVNPAITAMFAGSGVYNANIYASPPITAILGAILLVFALAAAFISAMGIKRISVYELISE